MNIGSQMDALVTCHSFSFNTEVIRRNFDLLPISDSSSTIVCLDGKECKKQAIGEYRPDGGVKHSYVPKVLRCGRCGIFTEGTMKRCGACRKVYYCCKEHQVDDLKARHKAICKSLAGKKEQETETGKYE